MSAGSRFACLLCLNHLNLCEKGQAYSKDKGETLASFELVSERRVGSAVPGRLQPPTVLSVRSLSSREGHVQPGQAQLQPRHGDPSALHAPLTVFN